MINLNNISKSFGERVILKDVNLSIFENQFIALVGRNGSGKSTLLKIMANILKPDEGKVNYSTGLQVAYFPQEIASENQDKTGRIILAEIMKIEPDKVVGKIGLSSKKLQFPIEKLDIQIKTLSGGEKNKLMLMLIFNSPADIFLLDEPTNNLDLRGLIFLENFILDKKKTFLVVSHDRKFLDRLTNAVIEINNKTNNIDFYHQTTYSAYLEKKEVQEKKEIENYKDFQKEKKRLEKSASKSKEKALKMTSGPKKRRDKDKFIVGFKKDRSKKIASNAFSIEKQIERLSEIEKPQYHLPLNLQFNFSERSGDIVFHLSGVETKQGNFHLGPINLDINFGDRVVLLGSNGEGKSVFLKLILGKYSLVSGTSQIGSRVKVGYLPQEIIFKNKETVLQYFFEAVEIIQSDGRKILKRFGFSADDMAVNYSDLSPGERSRLVLAALMAKDINYLVLDEPSNHLDPEALDRLKKALRDFPGTIVIVSHDRHLLDQIDINKTYLIKNGKINFLHNYHEYEKKVFL